MGALVRGSGVHAPLTRDFCRLLRGRPLLGCLLTFTIGGCSDALWDGSGAQIDTLAGGRVVITNNGVDASDSGGWRLQEDLRLGTSGEPGPEAFGRVGAVLADSLGMIYVLDTSSQEIRVFHPTGDFSHTIGRRGAGPGEFRMASGMTFGPADTLWVTDRGNRRYSAFDRDGTFLTSVGRPIREVGARGEFLKDGRFVDWAMSFPDERPGVIAGARVILHPIIFSADFERHDSLPPLEYSREMLTGGARPQPFFSSGLETFLDSDGSIWFAQTGEYRIYRRSLDGDTSLVFSLPADPAPVGTQGQEYVRKMMAGRPAMAAAYIEALPEIRPIIRGIFTDGSGHIFVIPELSSVPGGTVVDLFRENGRFLGRIPLPVRASLMPPNPLVVHATPDHLFVVVTDEFDVPYVSRQRILKEG